MKLQNSWHNRNLPKVIGVSPEGDAAMEPPMSERVGNPCRRAIFSTFHVATAAAAAALEVTTNTGITAEAAAVMLVVLAWT